MVTRESAAELLSVDPETIDRLIERGDLPITKRVGDTILIPYRCLLIYAGVARWRFQEIVDA